MKKFCGKCGALLDENGYCPNCDRKGQAGEGPYTKGQKGLRSQESLQEEDGYTSCREHPKQDNLRKESGKGKKTVGLLAGCAGLILILSGGLFLLRQVLVPEPQQQSFPAAAETMAPAEIIPTVGLTEPPILETILPEPVPEPAPEPAHEKPENKLTRGDIFTMGAYPNDKAPISWMVLDVEGDHALVISCYAVDCRPYHSEEVDVTWEQCELRHWLNHAFYDMTFGPDEKDAILISKVRAHKNPQFNVNAGNDTEDKIFLLSIQEAQNYLPTMDNRVCMPTSYAIQQGAYVNSNGSCWYWLRSPGCSPVDAASTNSDGSIDYDDGSVVSPRGTVRPAMWVRIDQ